VHVGVSRTGGIIRNNEAGGRSPLYLLLLLSTPGQSLLQNEEWRKMKTIIVVLALLLAGIGIAGATWNTVDGNGLSDRVYPGPLVEKGNIMFQNENVDLLTAGTQNNSTIILIAFGINGAFECLK
jgi:hypothetical protein